MTTPIDVPGLLTELGFTVLGEAADVHGITPMQAYKLIGNLEVQPVERVSTEGPDELGRTEQAWRTRMRDTGALADDSCHLFVMGHPGERPWLHVRLPAEPFLERLRERTGKFELVGIGASGSPVVGLTEEEWDNWILVADPAAG